ncbi:prepilin peptidase [Sphingomonas sp. VNH70]
MVIPLLTGTLLLLLLAAGIEDARTREIADGKNIAIALLAPAWWWAIGLSPPAMAVQAGVALIVFALFFGAFCLGQMGGGDVKMIGALALWLPPGAVLAMLMAMALIGGGITILFLIERRRTRAGDVAEIPYGVAIAAAGMLALANPILTPSA